MGIFDKITKKEKQESVSPSEFSVGDVTADMVWKVVEKLQSGTERDVIQIEVLDDVPALSGSKFGGTPYVETAGQIPVDSDGNQLQLLAQINLSELPDNPLFPNKGLLQFWVLNDDIYGMDAEFNLNANDTSRVTYRDFDSETVTAEQVQAFYKPYREDDDDYFPVDGEVSLAFSLAKEPISSEDYQFNALFMKEWSDMYPECPIDSIFDLPDDAVDVIYDDASGCGHKMGGYPCFTQDDPREYEKKFEEYQILLFQMDSIGTDDCEIMWGDAGVGNFFITQDALKELDFSNVLYTWDCG